MPWVIDANEVTPTRIGRVIHLEPQPPGGIVPSYRILAGQLPDGGYELNFAAMISPQTGWQTTTTIPIVILDHVYNVMRDAQTLWCRSGDNPVSEGGASPVPEGEWGAGSVQVPWSTYNHSLPVHLPRASEPSDPEGEGE